MKYDTTQVGGNYIIDTSYYVGDTLKRTWNGMRSDSVNNWDHFVVAPYFEATYDNTDDSYFPTKGINARFRYDYYIYHYCFNDIWEMKTLHFFNKSNNINAHIKAAIPVAKAFTILPSLWLHSNLALYEGRFTDGIVPSWMESYIGTICLTSSPTPMPKLWPISISAGKSPPKTTSPSPLPDSAHWPAISMLRKPPRFA